MEVKEEAQEEVERVGVNEGVEVDKVNEEVNEGVEVDKVNEEVNEEVNESVKVKNNVEGRDLKIQNKVESL